MKNIIALALIFACSACMTPQYHTVTVTEYARRTVPGSMSDKTNAWSTCYDDITSHTCGGIASGNCMTDTWNHYIDWDTYDSQCDFLTACGCSSQHMTQTYCAYYAQQHQTKVVAQENNRRAVRRRRAVLGTVVSVLAVGAIATLGWLASTDDGSSCPITTCNDGTCSSSTGSGTCSGHGGISR